MPQELLELVQEKLLMPKPAPEYKRVAMSLHDILSGDFFTEYIKKGEANGSSGDVLPLTVQQGMS
jgi:ribonuclease P/MRP protein subunit RPP40